VGNWTGTVEGVVKPVDADFWRGKRVFLTGHTGFKGAWLALMLNRLGAKVVGVSLPPTGQANLFTLARIVSVLESHFCDIRDAEKTATVIYAAQPEIVLHLAAQSLVRVSYREPLLTFATNVQGTANVLDALRHLDSVRVAVVVTTDKVYRNLEHSYPYRETDALGGHDPYSASKAAAEIVVGSYRDSYLALKNVAVATARAGNVIGGGDWSQDRLIPDAVHAWSTNQVLQIRRPDAIRPWQHVLEPLSAYLKLAEQLWHQPTLADAYNFGPETNEAASVRDVVQLAQRAYGSGQVVWGEGLDGPHEAGWLALETAKARSSLGIQPCWSLLQGVNRTVNWYRRQNEGADARVLCEADITEHEQAQTKGLSV
jgi:CDP-glucose 4,6-dehydratase